MEAGVIFIAETPRTADKKETLTTRDTKVHEVAFGEIGFVSFVSLVVHPLSRVLGVSAVDRF